MVIAGILWEAGRQCKREIEANVKNLRKVNFEKLTLMLSAVHFQ